MDRNWEGRLTMETSVLFIISSLKLNRELLNAAAKAVKIFFEGQSPFGKGLES
jgi:hypothetical protein